MNGYVKLYGSILGSSVWAESASTRIVWITMLAIADPTGHVEASVVGLARFANVTPTQCRTALDVLAAPDLDSKSPDYDGRRIERDASGWTILNYVKYRELRTAKQIATADRQARFRERNAQSNAGDVTERDVTEGNADKRTTAEGAASAVPPSPPPAADSSVSDRLSNTLDRRALAQVLQFVPSPETWLAEMAASLDGMAGHVHLSPMQLGEALRDYLGNGATKSPGLSHFRRYLQRAAAEPHTATSSRKAAGGGARNDAEIDGWLVEREAHHGK